VAIVIGVGGFLGLGEKAVAVPFERLDFNPPPLPTIGGQPAPGSGAGALAAVTGKDGAPRRIVLKMTKADLQAAPAFRRSVSGSTAPEESPPPK
jgi:hypothetical protein